MLRDSTDAIIKSLHTTGSSYIPSPCTIQPCSGESKLVSISMVQLLTNMAQGSFMLEPVEVGWGGVG